MAAKIIQFPKNQKMLEWEVEEQYRVYYDEEERFFREHGYYPHNADY